MSQQNPEAQEVQVETLVEYDGVVFVAGCDGLLAVIDHTGNPVEICGRDSDQRRAFFARICSSQNDPQAIRRTIQVAMGFGVGIRINEVTRQFEVVSVIPSGDPIEYELRPDRTVRMPGPRT